MKILKKGKLNTAIFKCKKCGTEFEADEKEIRSETYIQTKILHQNIADGIGTCHCPICGELTYALVPWVDHWDFD